MKPDYGSMDYIVIIASTSVPFYSLLDQYEWVADWKELQAVKKQIQGLKERRRDLRNTGPSKKEDVVAMVKAEWEELERQRRELFCKKIDSNLKGLGRPNLKMTLYDLTSRGEYGFPPFYPWSEIEKALEQLPEGDKTSKEISLGKLGKVVIISSWHSHHSHNKHGDIVEHEPACQKYGSNIGRLEIVHSAKHLGPPVVQGGKKSKTGTTKHGEMEMSHNKMGVMNMNIGSGGTENESSQSTN